MKNLPYWAKASQQVATHSVNVIKIEWVAGTITSNKWLQVHDSATTPAEAAVPLKSFKLSSDSPDYKEFKSGELNLANGLYLCVSSTDATKTLDTDQVSSVFVELKDPEVPAGVSVAGDLTTGRETLQVWAEASGPKKLMGFRVTFTSGNAGAPVFLQVHCADTPTSATIVAVMNEASINDTTVKTYWFGDGLSAQKLVSGVTKKGCTIAASSTGSTYTAWGSNVLAIRAEYL